MLRYGDDQEARVGHKRKTDTFFGYKTEFAILDRMKEAPEKAYIAVSEMAYKINEELFSYNKDSGEWFCSERNVAVAKIM